MKKYLFCIFFLLSITHAYAERQLAGVALFDTNSPRSVTLANLLAGHLENVIGQVDLFSIVSSKVLDEELRKFDCLEEGCIMRVAKKAGIALMINGSFDDAGDYVILRMFAYGIDIPYRGMCVYNYIVKIPIPDTFAAREFSYIMEEHAGYFIGKLMARYQLPIFFKDGGNGMKLQFGDPVSGKYFFNRYTAENDSEGIRIYDQIGSVTLRDSKITSVADGAVVQNNDFILVTFKDKSNFLLDFYYGRKKEIVFNKPSPLHALYVFLLTGPASALMPVMAPIFGYYRNNDWTGFTLWIFNVTPYLYLEIDGLVHWPKDLYKEHKTISTEVIARHRFGWYMFAAGGISLLADSIAHRMLRDASMYVGVHSLLGNSLTAGWLALTGGGAGHFYRGNRLWGYFYYHLNNIMWYLMLREFSPPERYNAITGRYHVGEINPVRAYSFLGALAALKIVEIVHAILMKDQIRNGDLLEEGFSVAPFIVSNDDGNVNFGARFCYRL